MERKFKNVWLEAGLALLLAVVLGLAGARVDDALQQKAVKQEQTDVKKKAAEENQEAVKQTQNSSEEETENEASEEAIADGQYPVLGKSSVTVEQMTAYFQSGNVEYPSEALSKGGADTIEIFCTMYYEEAEAEGVRAEVAFAQTMKETGWLQYGGDASIEQFNFAGIGTTGNGVPGNSYPDVRTGIRAQIQHLKAYATDDPLMQDCVDDRYEYVIKGSAPYVEWLGMHENPEGQGWATAENYGYSIVDMINKMKQL